MQAETVKKLDAERASAKAQHDALFKQMKAREDAERVASEERLAALRRQRIESAKAVAELQVRERQCAWLLGDVFV